MNPLRRQGILRPLGILGALAALGCLGFAVFGPTSAAAAQNGKVQLSVDGAAFTAHPSGSVVDTSQLAPGRGFAGVLGVRSRFAVPTELSVQFTGVHDDDNGCTPAEARVDSTCGAGQGDLGRHLDVVVAAATTATGRYHAVWRGRATRLEHLTTLGLAVPGNADRWLRIAGHVPAGVGNVVQGDTLRFGLRVVLAGHGAHGGSGVAGQHSGGGGGGSGVGGAHAGGGSSGGLAGTGVTTDLFVIGATLLALSGAMLMRAGRSRRVSSDGSSTARREPRPASPR